MVVRRILDLLSIFIGVGIIVSGIEMISAFASERRFAEALFGVVWTGFGFYLTFHRERPKQPPVKAPSPIQDAN